MGDVDGAQKMLRMYDSLMKSGKFTAAQNKANEDGVLNSISELVMICEKEGFIERYYTDGPKDRVDETIRDMKDYTRSLVVEEMNLGNLIENAVKENQRKDLDILSKKQYIFLLLELFDEYVLQRLQFFFSALINQVNL